MITLKSSHDWDDQNVANMQPSTHVITIKGQIPEQGGKTLQGGNARSPHDVSKANRYFHNALHVLLSPWRNRKKCHE